ncbi:MAG: phosphoglycerate mutase (2,3-diphosphoglycerate-independent) [Bacteroidetes bacterium CG2_30_33_31]|nr:MAG: phosphoglycerate mutase (2,3-diphosphoglycerate-independent) [Bacteroidetes bacterium CG2_30_33_31]
MIKKAILVIMDGWGKGLHDKSDAIFNAKTPFIDALEMDNNVGKSLLDACGEEVGLPDGQMGNSEVGHINIGAGRIVYQDLVRINKAVRDNSISENRVLVDALNYAKVNHKQVHFLGLVSDGGVHSTIKHLMKLIEITEKFALKAVFVHALTDGRDTDPRSGLAFVSELEDYLKNTHAKIASVCGRYFTMDRDKRWERVKRAYELLVNANGNKYHSALEAIKDSYSKNITDEFIEPSLIVDENEDPLTSILDGDLVICFNFRSDRLREITTVLTQKSMPEFQMQTIDLKYLTMTAYDESFKNVEVVFEKQNVQNAMGEYLSKLGKTQLRIAETEKYPHVTFFFSGGREEPFAGEDRKMISSPKVATYDLQPEMSAPELTKIVVEALNSEKYDFICLNFANSDMVGHTGVYNSIIKAIETVDYSVSKVVEAAKNHDYSVFLTADHGNSDFAINQDGSPNTAHSLNKVPAYLINSKFNKLKNGRLSDIAPTLLKIMELEIPKEMDGTDLAY